MINWLIAQQGVFIASASLDTASIEKNALPDAERIIIPPKQSK